MTNIINLPPRERDPSMLVCGECDGRTFFLYPTSQNGKPIAECAQCKIKWEINAVVSAYLKPFE